MLGEAGNLGSPLPFPPPAWPLAHSECPLPSALKQEQQQSWVCSLPFGKARGQAGGKVAAWAAPCHLGLLGRAARSSTKDRARGPLPALRPPASDIVLGPLGALQALALTLLGEGEGC